MQDNQNYRLGRRALIGGAGILGLSLGNSRIVSGQGSPGASPVDAQLPEEFIIDLSGPPDNLDPALTYSVLDWSILHSVYDSLLDFGEDGELVPLAAESFTTDDAMTFHVTLRAGMMFHDGTPVTASAITRAVNHLQAAESQISDLFRGITEVREIDELTAEIITDEPSAWLPSQIAVWLVLFPETATPESLATSPVGSGPYEFEAYDAGTSITMTRNESYLRDSPKGMPLAERVVYRFVPESSTRVADLSTGTADLVSSIPNDQLAEVEAAGNIALTIPILGTAFVRVATDIPPFDDPRVRRALNHAVDVDSIVQVLVGPDAGRLASFFPDPRGLGFDETLEPFAYDPDLARQLLEEAGVGDGFNAEFQLPSTSRTDVAEVIAANLEEVGIHVNIVLTDLAAFNQAWSDPQAPALRYATWRPLYDPHTFLSLVVDSEGYLSRYENPRADELIRAAEVEPDRVARADLYKELGALLHEEPAAIYLWNVTANYGVTNEFADWSPRGDEYILPLGRGENT